MFSYINVAFKSRQLLIGCNRMLLIVGLRNEIGGSLLFMCLELCNAILVSQALEKQLQILVY